MKKKENTYNPEIPKTPAKNPALKYISIAVLLIAAAGIWWWQSNSKILKNEIAVNSASVITTDTTENINESDMVTVQGGRFAMGGNGSIFSNYVSNSPVFSNKIPTIIYINELNHSLFK